MLGTVVLGIGIAIYVGSTPEAETNENSHGFQGNPWYGAAGIIVAALGWALVWISPMPEPPSAWVGVGTLTIGGWVVMLTRSKPEKIKGGMTIALTGAMLDTVLIIRASIDQFGW